MYQNDVRHIIDIAIAKKTEASEISKRIELLRQLAQDIYEKIECDLIFCLKIYTEIYKLMQKIDHINFVSNKALDPQFIYKNIDIANDISINNKNYAFLKPFTLDFINIIKYQKDIMSQLEELQTNCYLTIEDTNPKMSDFMHLKSIAIDLIDQCVQLIPMISSFQKHSRSYPKFIEKLHNLK